MVFSNLHEEYPKWSLLWKFGLDIPLHGVMMTNFVSHYLSCFNDLKLNNTITISTRAVSFDLVFYKLSEKVNFVDFLTKATRFLIFEWCSCWGSHFHNSLSSPATNLQLYPIASLWLEMRENWEKVFDVWTGIGFPVKNLKPVNHLKTTIMVSMETKVVSGDSILDKRSENFTWMDFEKRNRVFARRGGGAHMLPHLGFWNTKKGLVGIGLSNLCLWSLKSEKVGIILD